MDVRFSRCRCTLPERHASNLSKQVIVEVAGDEHLKNPQADCESLTVTLAKSGRNAQAFAAIDIAHKISSMGPRVQQIVDVRSRTILGRAGASHPCHHSSSCPPQERCCPLGVHSEPPKPAWHVWPMFTCTAMLTALRLNYVKFTSIQDTSSAAISQTGNGNHTLQPSFMQQMSC